MSAISDASGSPSLLPVLALVVSVSACALYLCGYRVIGSGRSSPLDDLPGPESRGFMHGSFSETTESNSLRLLAQWAKEYGNTFLYYGAFNIPKVYTLDTKALTHILASRDFERSEALRYRLGQLLGQGLLFSEGDAHRRQRKIMNPAFGATQLRNLSEVFIQKSLEMREVLSSKLSATNRSDERLEIDIFKWLNKATLDIIGIAGFEYDFNSLANESDKETNELYDAIHVIQTFDGSRLLGLIQMLWRPARIIPSKRDRVVASAQQTLYKIGMRLIAARREEILASTADDVAHVGKEDMKGRDLLTLLIRSNMASDLEDGERMSEDEILAQIATMIVAGHGTTSTALTWALFALMVSPVHQTSLRAEIRQVSTDTPSMDEINALPYLDAVVREVMRIHAPVAMSDRIAVRDCVVPLNVGGSRDKKGMEIDHISLPKGAIVKIPIQTINKSKEIWGEDAEEFRPERWLGDRKAKTEAQVHAHGVPSVWGSQMSFLSGTHACIGYRFSIFEMKYLLFTLIRSFEFEFAISPEDIGRQVSVVGRPYICSNPAAEAQLPVLMRAVPETT